MRHSLKVVLDEKNDLKESIRISVDNFFKEKNWKEFPFYNSINMEINLDNISKEKFALLCNNIYPLKTWVNEKYNGRVTIFFS